MLIRIIIFIICILCSNQASANIFSSMFKCIKDPCNCGFDKKYEYWAEGNCNNCKFKKTPNGYEIDSCDDPSCKVKPPTIRNPSNLCPPYNKDGGRKNFTCLTKPDSNYPVAFVPLFFEKCIEHTEDSTYKKPQVRLRTQTCNEFFCWTKNNTLSWDGECVTLAGGYGFPLNRICARIAIPRQVGSGIKGEPNYIPDKPSDPGYTQGVHINNLGIQNKDPLTILSDGTKVKFIHPKLCAYYDPAFMGLDPPSVDFFDLNPNKQPLHAHTNQKSVIIKIIDFFVDAAEDVSDGAVSLIKQLIKSMSGEDGSDEQDGTTFWSILSDVFKYIGWLIDKILDLLKKILDDIGGLNRVVEANLGCVELPIGPYPPPFWPVIVDLFDEPRTEKVCHQNKVGDKMLLKALSVDFDPCIESELENNAINNSIRVTYDKFIPLCNDDSTDKTCVKIKNKEILNSIMQHNNSVFIENSKSTNRSNIDFISYNHDITVVGNKYFHMPKILRNCNDMKDQGSICVHITNICNKTTDSSKCLSLLKELRLVFNIKVGSTLNLRNAYVYDIDLCNPGDPNQATCQEIWGVNIGDFVDIPVSFKSENNDDGKKKLLPPVCAPNNSYFISNQTALSKKDEPNKIQLQAKNYSLNASIVKEVTNDADYEDDDADNTDKRGNCFQYSFSGQSPENICAVNTSTKELVGCQRRVPPAYINIVPSNDSDYYKPKAIAMLSAENLNSYLDDVSHHNLSIAEKNVLILSKSLSMSSIYTHDIEPPNYYGDDGNYKKFSDTSDSDYNKFMNQQNILGFSVAPHVTDESFSFPPHQSKNANIILGTKFGNYVYKNFQKCFEAGDVEYDNVHNKLVCKYYTIEWYSYDHAYSLNDKDHKIDPKKFVPIKNHYKTRNDSNDVDDDDCDDEDENDYDDDDSFDKRLKYFNNKYKDSVKYCIKKDSSHFAKKFLDKYLIYVGGVETFNYIPDDKDNKIVRDVYIRGGTKICLDTRNTDIGRCPEDPRNCVLTQLENFDIIDCKKFVHSRSSLSQNHLNIHPCPTNSNISFTPTSPPTNMITISADQVQDQKTKDLISGKTNITDEAFNILQQKKFNYLVFYYYSDKKLCFAPKNNAPQDIKDKIQSGLCKISTDINKRIIPDASADLTQYENTPGKTYFPVDLSSPPPSYYGALQNINQDEGGKFAGSIGNTLITPVSDRTKCIDYLQPNQCLDTNQYYQCDPNQCLDIDSCKKISLAEIDYHQASLKNSGCLKGNRYDCTSADCVQNKQQAICHKIEAQDKYITKYHNATHNIQISLKYEPTTADFSDNQKYSKYDNQLQVAGCIDNKKYICDSLNCKDSNRCEFIKNIKIQKYQQAKSDAKKLCLNDISAYQTSSTYADNTNRSQGLYSLYNPMVNALRNKTPQELRKCVDLSQRKCDDLDSKGFNKDGYPISQIDVNKIFFQKCNNGTLIPTLCYFDNLQSDDKDPKKYKYDDLDIDDNSNKYCNSLYEMQFTKKYYDKSTNIHWEIDKDTPDQVIGRCNAGYHIEPSYDKIQEDNIHFTGEITLNATTRSILGIDSNGDIKIKDISSRKPIITSDDTNLASNIQKIFDHRQDKKDKQCNTQTNTCGFWLKTTSGNHYLGLLTSKQLVNALRYYENLSNERYNAVKGLYVLRVKENKFSIGNYALISYWPNARCVRH